MAMHACERAIKGKEKKGKEFLFAETPMRKESRSNGKGSGEGRGSESELVRRNLE